jgi:hypothetical protein
MQAYLRILCLSLMVSIVSQAKAQSSRELRMTCQHGSKTYSVTYDAVRRVFKTDNAEVGSSFRLKREQIDGEGSLVWVGATHIGGERDVLAKFGPDKWVRYFYGNGSQVMDRCR